MINKIISKIIITASYITAYNFDELCIEMVLFALVKVESTEKVQKVQKSREGSCIPKFNCILGIQVRLLNVIHATIQLHF